MNVLGASPPGREPSGRGNSNSTSGAAVWQIMCYGFRVGASANVRSQLFVPLDLSPSHHPLTAIPPRPCAPLPKNAALVSQTDYTNGGAQVNPAMSVGTFFYGWNDQSSLVRPSGYHWFWFHSRGVSAGT